MLKLPKLPRHMGKNFERLNEKQLMVIAGAVSCLLGLMLYFVMPTEQAGDKQAAKANMLKVVVAKQDIPKRTVVKENMLKVIEMPADAVPAGALQSVQEAVEHPATVTIQQGDVLTGKKVLLDPKMAGFTGTIPSNCRAISVGINDITGVAGFAKPGDFVDVMIVRKDRSETKGEILLQNVLLLGINKMAGSAQTPPPAGGKDDKNKDNNNAVDVNASKDAMATATLALNSDEALKLAVSSQNATVYLMLRSVEPSDIFTLYTEYSIQNGEDKAAPPAQAPVSAPAPSAPPAPPVPSAPAAPVAAPSASSSVGDGIEVIRGAVSSTVGGN